MRAAYKLLSFLLLYLLIATRAIELRENSSRKQHLTRLQKSRAGSRLLTPARGVIGEGASLLFGLLSKEDFHLSGGFELTIGAMKIPISIELFFAESGQMEWTYHPSAEDMKSIYKTLENPEKVAKTVVALAENLAISFISTIVMKNAKYLIATFFPPLTVLLYVHDLIKESGISITKEKGSSEGRDLFKIRYKYELQEDPKLICFMQLTVNATKILGGLAQFSDWLSSRLTVLWNAVPEPLREGLKVALSAAGDVISKIVEGLQSVLNLLRAALASLKTLAVEKIAEGYQWLVLRAHDVWDLARPATTFIAFTVQSFAQDCLGPLLKSIWGKGKNILEDLANLWKNVSAAVGDFIRKVGESLVAAGKSVVLFTVDAAKLIWGWAFGFRRYRRFYLHLNRLYLMNRYGRHYRRYV